MDLTINKEYIVYGVCYHDYSFNYLVYEDTGNLFWYQSELFEIINDKVPSSWYFSFLYHLDSQMKMLWGYDELVNNEDHNDDLLDKNESAERIFYKRKAEIEEEESYF